MIGRELVTGDPATVSPDTSVARIWDMMRRLDVRHVPVVEGAFSSGW